MTAARTPAPAFQLEVRAPFFWRAAHGLAWGLAWLAAGAAASLQLDRLPPVAVPRAIEWLSLLLLPVVCWLGMRTAQAPPFQLLWDGRAFALREGPLILAASEDVARQAVEVQVVLDAGGFLLLRCRPHGAEAAASRPPPWSKPQPCGPGAPALSTGQPVRDEASMTMGAPSRRPTSTAAPATPRAAIFLPVLQARHPEVWLRLRWALFSARHLPPAPP